MARHSASICARRRDEPARAGRKDIVARSDPLAATSKLTMLFGGAAGRIGWRHFCLQ